MIYLEHGEIRIFTINLNFHKKCPIIKFEFWDWLRWIELWRFFHFRRNVYFNGGAKEVENFNDWLTIGAAWCGGSYSNRNWGNTKTFQMVSVSLLPSPPEEYKIKDEITKKAVNRISEGQANCHFSKIKFSS